MARGAAVGYCGDRIEVVLKQTTEREWIVSDYLPEGSWIVSDTEGIWTVRSDSERTRTTHLADDGEHLVVVERWLDGQVRPPEWRSKNWRRKLNPTDIEYYRQQRAEKGVEA